MHTLKEESIQLISRLPDTAEIDDIMYRLYVIDKIKKGEQAVIEGKVISLEDLKKEIKKW